MQALLVTVMINLSEPAFQRLSQFAILTLNAPVTLKTKQPLPLQNMHVKLKTIVLLLNKQNLPLIALQVHLSSFEINMAWIGYI